MACNRNLVDKGLLLLGTQTRVLVENPIWRDEIDMRRKLRVRLLTGGAMSEPMKTSALNLPGQSGPPFGGLAGALRPWLVLALVCVLFSLEAKFRTVFWTRAYLPNVLQQSARNIVLAVGMTFVILTGGIDLSVGAVLALSGVSLALSLSGGLPAWLAWTAALPLALLATWLATLRMRGSDTASRVLLPVSAFALAEAAIGWGIAHGVAGGIKVEGAVAMALLVGVACGLVNGLVISVGRVPPFVMTLGTLSAARGLTLYATDGSSVPAAIPRFMALGQGLPLVLVVLIVVLLGTLLLKWTRMGRYILAVGGNESASRLTGVPVVAVKTCAY